MKATKARPVLTLEFPTLTMAEAMLLVVVLEGPDAIAQLLAQLSGWTCSWPRA